MLHHLFSWLVLNTVQKSSYGQPHAFGKIKCPVRSHFLQTQKAIQLNPCNVLKLSSIQTYFLPQREVKQLSLHTNHKFCSGSISMMKVWNFREAFHMPWISIRFVFQTRCRKSSKYPQTYRSKQS